MFGWCFEKLGRKNAFAPVFMLECSGVNACESCGSLERIANGKVPSEAVFQRVEVEVAAALCLVGCVKAKAKIYTQHKDAQVVACAIAGV